MSYINNNLIPEIEADLNGLCVEYHQEFGSFQNVSEATNWVAKKLIVKDVTDYLRKASIKTLDGCVTRSRAG